MTDDRQLAMTSRDLWASHRWWVGDHWCSVISQKHCGAAGTGRPAVPARDGLRQKATTPSTMKPLIFPPLRMSTVGKSLYICCIHSVLNRTVGTMNQPAEAWVRSTVTSLAMPGSVPFATLYRLATYSLLPRKR